MPDILRESPESSSPIVTRAVAVGLQNRFTDNYNIPSWQKLVLIAIGNLPPGAARYIISRFQSYSGLPLKSLNHFWEIFSVNLSLHVVAVRT
jgi:hypothetical protein